MLNLNIVMGMKERVMDILLWERWKGEIGEMGYGGEGRKERVRKGERREW